MGSLHTDPTTLNEVLCGELDTSVAIDNGRLRADGDRSKRSALIDAVRDEHTD